MGTSSLSTSCMKIMMFSLNILIWFLGVLILVAGICFRIDQATWDTGSSQLQGFTNAFYVIIVIGAVLFVIGFLGCWGVLRENSFSLGVYFVIVLILLILEVAAIVLVWKYGNGAKLRTKFNDILKKQLNKDLTSPREDSSKSFLEFVEKKLECCGADGPLDYEIVPASCNNENQVVNERGCSDALMKFFDIRIGIIGGVCIGLLILQVAFLVMAFFLIRNFRRAEKSCVEVAADDVQLAYIPGQHYVPEKSVKIKEVNESTPSKEEAKLIKAQKKKEAKEAEKLRKAEEKKQKEADNSKEKEMEKTKAQVEEAMKSAEKEEVVEHKGDKEELKKDAESTTSKDSRDKELQAEQKKLAEEAQKMLQEKRKKNTEQNQRAATEKESGEDVTPSAPS